MNTQNVITWTIKKRLTFIHVNIKTFYDPFITNNYSITNWRVSFSKQYVTNDQSNAVILACSQRRSELQHYLVMNEYKTDNFTVKLSFLFT